MNCILTEESHNRATYFLTGPEVISYQDAAEKLSRGLGYEVKNVIVLTSDMRKRLEGVGLEDWRINSFIAQEQVKNGFTMDVTEEVQRLTGQAPISFEQFAKDYQQQFEQDE